MNLEAKIIKPKLGLLELSRQLGSVTQACKVFGYSRDSFYRFKKLYEEGGELALRDIVRLNRPNPKNRVDPEIESRVVKIALDNPALGQQRVSNELRKEGLFISPGGVRSVWQRHDLETFQKRLKALDAKVAQEGIILTESQLQALEKAKEEKQAAGEIETEHPGYLIAQDTFYVGNREVDKQIVKEGDTLNEPAAPTGEGSEGRFLGWVYENGDPVTFGTVASA